MMRAISLFVFIYFLASATVYGQTFDVSPAKPQAGQPFTISGEVLTGGNYVKTQGYTIEGSAISVFFVQDGLDVFNPNPPRIRASQMILGLQPGTYTVTASWNLPTGLPAPNSPQVFQVQIVDMPSLPALDRWALSVFAIALLWIGARVRLASNRRIDGVRF